MRAVAIALSFITLGCVSASARSARAMVVMARTPYHYVIRNGAGGRSWPILMLIGYADASADFDAWLPDFQRFVQAIDLRSDAGD